MLLRIFLSLSLSLFGFLTCVLNNELCDLVKERVELGSNQPSTASSKHLSYQMEAALHRNLC